MLGLTSVLWAGLHGNIEEQIKELQDVDHEEFASQLVQTSALTVEHRKVKQAEEKQPARSSGADEEGQHCAEHQPRSDTQGNEHGKIDSDTNDANKGIHTALS